MPPPQSTMQSEEGLISSRDYCRLRELIYAEAGICLGPEKKTMLEVRIKRRLKDLDHGSYREYCDYLFSDAGDEGGTGLTSSTSSPPTRPISFANRRTSNFSPAGRSRN